jgi:hypothetical protein
MRRQILILGAAVVLLAGCGWASAQDALPSVAPAPIVVQVPAAPPAAPRVTAPAGATTAIPQPDGSTVFLYPLIHDLEPVLVTALGTLLAALSTIITGFLLWWLKTKFGYDADQATQDKLVAATKAFQDYATRQANVWIAAQEPGWRDLKVDVGNPFVAAAANEGIARMPDGSVLAEMTQKKLSEWIAAAIGHAQATTPPVVTAPIAVPPVVVAAQ